MEAAGERKPGDLSWASMYPWNQDHGLGVARTEILASYPSLNQKDINAALGYAAALARERSMDLPLELSG